MLDIKYIRENPELVNANLANRGSALTVEPLIASDEKRRSVIVELEGLQKERNVASKKIGELKKAGENADDAMAAVRDIGSNISDLEEQRRVIEAEANELLLALPNLLHDSVPVGRDEEANVEIRVEGQPVTFDFEPKAHWDLGDDLGIFDFKRAARMTGAGFQMLVGQGSKLSRALIQFMLDLHTTEHGYTEIAAPFVCNSDAMTGTGQLPKMAEDMYRVPEDDLWLIPTAEVPLTNIYREEILDRPLPVMLTGYTPCFRREAGAAGKMTRGLNRLHQFDKVELVKLVEPSTSYDELEKLMANAEAVLQKLGLHYRVLSLCSGDVSFASAKTYDLELWAPGQNCWLEVSSCSNFGDFQARRAGIRYRDADGKTQFVHTLNGSGVALPRLIVAILENGQQADGSILLPEALWPYMGGQTTITLNN